MEKTPKIHDNTIKFFLSDKKNVISIIRALLPKEIQEHLDIDKIRYEKDSFIPKHLKEYFSDLLTSVPTKCGTSETRVLFLLEHKSTFKKFTPLQFLRYMIEFWDHCLRNMEEHKDKLPIVIPILIAHPEYGWRALKVSDLVDLPSDDFKIYIPDFDFLLFDAVKDDPENYEFNEAVKALFTIWKYAVPRIYSVLPEIVDNSPTLNYSRRHYGNYNSLPYRTQNFQEETATQEIDLTLPTLLSGKGAATGASCIQTARNAYARALTDMLNTEGAQN
jgi:hypothetical protein